MSDTPRTDAVCKCAIGQQLERELAETVIQVKLAQKGYDYMGACEDARHYKELATSLREELAEARTAAEKWMSQCAEWRDANIKLGEELADAKRTQNNASRQYLDEHERAEAAESALAELAAKLEELK